jgi:hypothetical protein
MYTDYSVSVAHGVRIMHYPQREIQHLLGRQIVRRKKVARDWLVSFVWLQNNY